MAFRWFTLGWFFLVNYSAQALIFGQVLHFHLIENNYSRFIKCRCVFSLGHDEIVERIYSFQRSTLSKWSRLMFTRDYRKISIALQLSCKFVNYSGHSLWNPKYANIISFALFFSSQKPNFITNDVFYSDVTLVSGSFSSSFN